MTPSRNVSINTSFSRLIIKFHLAGHPAHSYAGSKNIDWKPNYAIIRQY
jgi:hypothetical protein